METQTAGTTAYVIHTDIPGLVDVVTADGTEYRDLTMGQLSHLQRRYGWALQPAPSTR